MTAPRIFLFLFCAFMLLTSREPPWADAHVVYDTTRTLVDNARLDVRLESGPPWFYAHRDGKKYGVFPLGNVIAMVPSYVAYKLLRAHPAAPRQAAYALAAHVAPSLMMAAACVLFFVVARRRGAHARLGHRRHADPRLRHVHLHLRALALLRGAADAGADVARRAHARHGRTADHRRHRLARRRRRRARQLQAGQRALPARSSPGTSSIARCRRGDLDARVARPAAGRRRLRRVLRRSRCGTTTSRPARSSTAATRSRTASSPAISSPASTASCFSTGKSAFLYSPPLVLAVLGAAHRLAAPPRRDRAPRRASSRSASSSTPSSATGTPTTAGARAT